MLLYRIQQVVQFLCENGWGAEVFRVCVNHVKIVVLVYVQRITSLLYTHILPLPLAVIGHRQYIEIGTSRVGIVQAVRAHVALVDVDGYKRGITRMAYKAQINGGRGTYKPI